MANLADDARSRLQRAALELFDQRGYDGATAAEIAARAGVTERTFFRYFPDKREVLFDGQDTLKVALVAAIAETPHELGPLDTLFRAFRSVLPMLENNRAYSEPRQRVIAATSALQEREMAKHGALSDALEVALQERGIPDLSAALAARVGMAAFVHATAAWLNQANPSLDERLDDALRELKKLAIGPGH